MKTLLIAVLLSSFSFAAFVPGKSPAWKKLAAFVGTWKSQGQLLDTPMSKRKVITATTTCRFSPKGDYLICDQLNDAPAHQLTIYSASRDGNYAASTIGDAGMEAHSMKLSLAGNTWTYSSDYTANGKTTRFRTTNTFTSPDIYTFEAQYSEDGQHWTTMAQGTSRRIRQ